MIVVPSEMGRLNVRTVLGRLQKVGTASRAELAKSLGMSQPTVGRIVDELLQLNVLEEVGTQNDQENNNVRLGRPGRLLRLDSAKPRFLSIQLGVSETSLAATPVGFNGEDAWTMRIPTPESQRGVNASQNWLRSLVSAAARLPEKEFWAVLVSVPGIVDEKTGRILYSPNLHWTEQADVAKLIQKVWKAPVVLVQEERALALGHQSADASGEDFMLVDFGEGVGGAVILEGKLYANPLPISGELGHTPVLGNRRQCGCGTVGCMETLVSTRGLLQSHTEHQQAGQPATWQTFSEHIARHGIEPWLAHTLDAAAVAIAGALNVLGLRRVVITGSLTELPPLVIAYLSESIVRGALWARFGKVECEAASRRRMAGLVAAGIERVVIAMAGQNSRATAPHNGHVLNFFRQPQRVGETQSADF